ncbi:ATP-dependent helicase HrpB [Coralloluteibacterium thermophilus]|uniref:ATP-dependent helicase HrpB n=1 Tax=Coralloluteibacterium thermophilum TaxID=2707049 RepID=A0ABV9NLW6_9GAMM
MQAPRFPIEPLLPAILRSLAAHPRLVLEAPPGAGKTTQVPPALLDAPWLAGRRVIVLEPRRVAARAAARFMAQALGEEVGGTVGYRIRFENRVSARTRIEVVTEGILTRMIQDDPMLEGVGAILFDEFHERHLSGDLGLALALDVQAQVREDLRVVAMSATLDGARLARFLDAPRLTAEGRAFPVAIAHVPARRDEALEAQVRRCVLDALAAHPGDVLVFLPGAREIARVEALLADAGRDVDVLPLHGDLPLERQAAALAPADDARRRVILATNVAESSVTAPGVRVVVDSGLAREPRQDPNSGFARLATVAIAQASADQRAGRAGRVAEGWCYRLWPASQRLEPQRRPEIAQVDLAGLALEMAGWGSSDLRLPDPPPPGALAAARELLQRLGALDAAQAITPFGRRVLALGVHPRLGAMLLAAEDAPARALACDLVALVEARDPLRGGSGLRDDWQSRHRALAALRGGRGDPEAHRSALQAIDQAARNWRRRLRVDAEPPREVPAHALGDLLAHAFPDRIARQHPDDPRRYQLANGRSARIVDESALYGEPWLVVSELRGDPRGGDGLVLRAAPVDAAALERDFAARFVEEDRVVWDARTRGIAAVRERRFDRIVLDVRPLPTPDRSRFADALVDAVRQLGLDALPWTPGLVQWRERVRCLRDWMPELGLPDLSDAALLDTLDDWLKPALAGLTRLDALDEADFGEALRSGIDWSLRQRIDALAPVRIAVPSGLERTIAYAHDAPPVLAVKLQELFGLAETPRIAEGRVPLTLHLLSPAGRPLQVTRDLASFWANTYPDVRKEMKGRYPRHPWPEDPWSATATHRAKPRGT